MMDPAAESDWVASARAGDGAAFDRLVRLHQARLRALAARYVFDADDVHDLVQEAFIDAWRHLDRFELGREFGPWLRTLCRNRVSSFLRARAARRTRPLALVDEALASRIESDDCGSEGELAALKACLDQLGEEQRRLVERRYGQGEAVKDIALGAGKSEGSIVRLLGESRARCVFAPTAAPTADATASLIKISGGSGIEVAELSFDGEGRLADSALIATRTSDLRLRWLAVHDLAGGFVSGILLRGHQGGDRYRDGVVGAVASPTARASPSAATASAPTRSG